LEKLYYRLESQHACLAWAFGQIAGVPGVVFELGLGKGRTYDHLRLNLPDRHIYVFERTVEPIEDCMPPERFLVQGEIAETLPLYAERFRAQVILAHADTGSFSDDHNRRMSRLVAALLPPAMAPGGLVLSDLPLDLPGFEAVALPPGAREGRYHIYRRPMTEAAR
jgi:hypothetical protein